MNNNVKLLNINIQSITKVNLLKKMTKGLVLTPNISHLSILQKDSDFYKIYESADYILCDSQIIFFILKMLRTPISEKISGSDLLPSFCEYNLNSDTRIFLLGASNESIVKKAKQNINNRYGKNIIVDCYSPSYGFEINQTENEYIIKKIKASRANVLAVGVGAPKQEKWIFDHRNKLPSIDLFLGVGATIDFEAGILKRAPKWMRGIGLEWIHRLIQEPRRLWKRYLLDGFHVLIDIYRFRLGLYKNPWE